MATIFKAKSWWQFTLTRTTLALMAGILLGKYLPIPQWLLGLCLSAFILTWFLTDRLNHQHYFSKRWISGIAILLVFVCVGIGVYQSNTNLPIQVKSTVIILETPIKKPNSFQTTAAMGETVLLIYFNPTVKMDSIKAGTTIQLLKKPQRIQPVSNPGGFNFQLYAASQKIFHQVYLTRTNFNIIGQTNLPIASSLLNNAKEFVLSTLEKNITLPRERGVAEALLIGFKKNLDKELMNAYSNTGVIHIIAISGLHLGMIYALLLWLFKPLNRLKKFQWLKPLIILLILWGFTLLTGAGASVLRAAVMFSFLILGAQQNRPNQIMNTLAASAFCLLLFNPLFLWDIGFQLSYAAVIGIIAFSKPIEKWIYLENKILSYCWQLCSVTLAAQLLTLPLLLYYFNSFPNLFLFTNFIAVPVSGIILYALIILLVIAPFNIIAKPIGTLIEWLLLQLNGFIENSASLPFALTQYIQVSLLQTICLYVFMLALVIFITEKKLSAWWTACAGLIVFTALRSLSIVQHQHQQKILIYHAPKYTAIDVLEGLGHRYIGNPLLERNILLKNNYLIPSRTLYRAGDPLLKTHSLVKGSFVIGPNKKVLLLHPRLTPPNLYMVPKVDLIVLSNGSTISLLTIANLYPKAILVFDSSNPLWKIQLWKKEAERLHLRHHSVPEQGAFEYNL